MCRMGNSLWGQQGEAQGILETKRDVTIVGEELQAWLWKVLNNHAPQERGF